MWQCMKCREKLEDSFDVCWNCGTSKEGIHDSGFQPDVATEGKRNIFCPKCGAKLPNEGECNFCPKCGARQSAAGHADSTPDASMPQTTAQPAKTAAKAVGFGLGGLAIAIICVLIGVVVGIAICMGMLDHFLRELFKPLGGR